MTDDTSKPAETASDVYRFEVKVPAGKTATQVVTEERVIGSQVQLTNSNDDQMRFFINSTVSQSEGERRSEARQSPLRWALNKTQREASAEQQLQLKTITEDQVRGCGRI